MISIIGETVGVPWHNLGTFSIGQCCQVVIPDTISERWYRNPRKEESETCGTETPASAIHVLGNVTLASCMCEGFG